MQRGRGCQSFFTNAKLDEALKDTVDFSARATSLDIRQSVVDGSKVFTAQTEPVTSADVDCFAKSLPTQDGVIVMVINVGDAEAVLGAFDILVAHVLASWPDEPAVANVCKALGTRVALHEFKAMPAVNQRWEANIVLYTSAVNLYSLKQVHDQYIALGQDVASRVGADSTLVKVRTLMRAKVTVGMPLSNEDMDKFSNKSAVEELQTKVDDAIQAHGNIYLAQHEPTLTKCLNALKPMAYGGSDEESWKKDMQDNVPRIEMVETARHNVLRVKPEIMCAIIKTAAVDRLLFADNLKCRSCSCYLSI